MTDDRTPAPGSEQVADTDHAIPVPDYARTILVPISNPHTAAALLTIAGSLADIDEGRVVALAVVTDDTTAEQQQEALEELEDLVDSTSWLPGVTFEMVTRSAATVARGILDAGAEYRADMILLGVRQTRQGDVSLGSVVESVMSTASADVVVVRIPASVTNAMGAITRIIVAVDGSDESRAAVRVGVLLGASIGVKVHVIHVVGSEVPRAVGLATIERSLDGVEGGRGCSRELVVANDVSHGILAQAEESDLVIVGTHVGRHLLEWGTEAAAAAVLRDAPGPVLTVARNMERRTLAGIAGRLRPKLTALEQDSVIWQSERLAGLGVDFVLLMAVSGLLASFGLLQNSPAVVIGAMLVAPLLGPLTAVSVGLVTARLRLSRRASLTVLAGAGIAVACGWILGLVVPLESPTAEMLSRARPTLLDAGVAISAGAVGAYATARKEIPAALAGVAIAAALVPPLCTIGLGLAIGDESLALGAVLLFVTNTISVAVIGFGVFLWFGMRPDRESTRQRRRVLSLGIVGVLTLAMVLVVLDVVQDARVAVIAEQDLAGIFPEAEVVHLDYEAGDPIRLVATLRTERTISRSQVAAVERGLEIRFDTAIDLSVVVETVVRPSR
jgi:uncharacterized hydrophobic protein (TIGR00271 family)